MKQFVQQCPVAKSGQVISQERPANFAQQSTAEAVNCGRTDLSSSKVPLLLAMREGNHQATLVSEPNLQSSKLRLKLCKQEFNSGDTDNFDRQLEERIKTFFWRYLGESEAGNVAKLKAEGMGMIAWLELSQTHLLQGGEIVSAIIVTVDLRCAEILSICTHPIYWNQGLGTMLLEEGERYASSRSGLIDNIFARCTALGVNLLQSNAYHLCTDTQRQVFAKNSKFLWERTYTGLKWMMRAKYKGSFSPDLHQYSSSEADQRQLISAQHQDRAVDQCISDLSKEIPARVTPVKCKLEAMNEEEVANRKVQFEEDFSSKITTFATAINKAGIPLDGFKEIIQLTTEGAMISLQSPGMFRPCSVKRRSRTSSK